MAEATRVFAFDAFVAAASASPRASPGVTIASRHAGAMLNVRGDARDAGFLRDASAAFHVALPVVPNTVSGADGMRALWLGPDEWLVVCELPHPSPLPKGEGMTSLLDLNSVQTRISGAAPQISPRPSGEGPGVRGEGLGMREKLLANATLTDVSHGRAILRLFGPDVRAPLAQGCPLDLDPRAFPVDACAQTAIAKINVIIDHVRPGVFDLYCPRSYAGSFWHWITEAAAEYGCNIARPA